MLFRERKKVYPDGRRGREEMQGIKGEKIIISIYYVRKVFQKMLKSETPTVFIYP